jgi:hypothetical protein
MIEPGNSFGNRCDGRAIRNRRPPEHEYRDPEQSGCRNLAVGRLSPAVLCHHGVDGERLEYRPVLSLREGPTRKDVVRVRHIERRLDGIDTADEIVVLWCGAEWSQFLPPDRQKDSPGARAQRTNCVLCIGDIDPDIAVHSGPGQPAHSKNRSVGLRSGPHGISGDRFGVRVCGIDQEVDVAGAKIFCESVGTPKTASAHRNGLRGGSRRPAGKRNRRGEVTAGEREPELASLRGPSQNQNVWAHGHLHP